MHVHFEFSSSSCDLGYNKGISTVMFNYALYKIISIKITLRIYGNVKMFHVYDALSFNTLFLI